MTEHSRSSGLAGRCVVVTRPVQQAQALLDALSEAGAEPLFFCVTEIVPLANTSSLQILAEELPDYDIAFFVSANAVEQTLAVIPPARWPASLRVATVGPGSARVLRSHGFDDVMMPASRFDSEGVLALPEMQAAMISDKRVLILRGDGGRELLAHTLIERGARVTVQGCYQRRRADTDPADFLARFAAGGIDAISFTSSEGARNFVDIIDTAGAYAGRARSLLAMLPCFVPHPRIAEVLRTLGAQDIVLTDAGDAALIASLEHHFR